MRTELDCRGMPCPRPVIELAKAMVGVTIGDEVRVVADDPAARVDVEAWCRMRGQGYAGQEVAEDGTPAYVVRRIS